MRKMVYNDLFVDTLPPTSSNNNYEIEVAEALHDIFCVWNHIDGCSWHYESWDNVGNTRRIYLKKAQKVIKLCDNLGIDVHTVIQLLQIVQQEK